jgi:hypothetical protein
MKHIESIVMSVKITSLPLLGLVGEEICVAVVRPENETREKRFL